MAQTLTIIGNYISPYVRKVLVCLELKGIPYRIDPIAPFVGDEDFSRLSPLRRIPVLIDGELVLNDSTVICEYLDSLHAGARLFPQQPERRWQALRWHALADNMLDNLILWRNETLRPRAQQSPETITAWDRKIRSALSALDKEAEALGKAPVSIGHVAIGVALGYIDFRFPGFGWREANKRIAGWYEIFSQRPSMRNTLPVDA